MVDLGISAACPVRGASGNAGSLAGSGDLPRGAVVNLVGDGLRDALDPRER